MQQKHVSLLKLINILMSCCHHASVYQEIKDMNPSNVFVTSSSGSNEYFMAFLCPGVSLWDPYIIYTSTLIGTEQVEIMNT